jgi:hypothetical protein
MSGVDIECVRLACVNEQDGESCLIWACGGGHWDIAKYLCELGGEKLLMLQSKARMCAIVVGATCMYVHRDMQGLVGALGAYMRNQRSICVSVCSSTLVGSPSLHFRHIQIQACIQVHHCQGACRRWHDPQAPLTVFMCHNHHTVGSIIKGPQVSDACIYIHTPIHTHTRMPAYHSENVKLAMMLVQ